MRNWASAPVYYDDLEGTSRRAGYFPQAADSNKLSPVLLFVRRMVHLPFHQFIITVSSILGFDLCQRMKYFYRLREPGAGIFLGKRKTLTNYSMYGRARFELLRTRVLRRA